MVHEQAPQPLIPSPAPQGRGVSGSWEPPTALDQAAQALAARSADPQNLDLRDREHALFSKYILDQYGPQLGSLIVGAAAPTYSGVKALAQSNPQLGALLGKMSGQDLTQATPASWREVQAGLSPVVEMLKQAWWMRGGQ